MLPHRINPTYARRLFISSLASQLTVIYVECSPGRSMPINISIISVDPEFTPIINRALEMQRGLFKIKLSYTQDTLDAGWSWVKSK